MGEQTRHEWVRKVIHRELRFKFDQTTKWYMHKPEPALENEIYIIIWDFKIKTDHLITAWRPNQVFIKRKKYLLSIGSSRFGG